MQTRRDTSHLTPSLCRSRSPRTSLRGISQAVSIIQHQEEMRQAGTEGHRGALKAYESVREASLQRLYTVCSP